MLKHAFIRLQPQLSPAHTSPHHPAAHTSPHHPAAAPLHLQIQDESSAVVAAIESQAWQEQLDKALEGSRKLASRWELHARQAGLGDGLCHVALTAVGWCPAGPRRSGSGH